MNQEEFILKAYAVISQCGKTEDLCIKRLAKVIGIPIAEIKRVLTENGRHLTKLNNQPKEVADTLSDFPDYTLKNLSNLEKDYYAKNTQSN